MVFMVIILLVVTLFVAVRIYALKKEVKKLTLQLHQYNQRQTNQKLEMDLFDRDLEELGMEVNKLIDLYIAEQQKHIRFANEQKQLIANMSHDLRTPLTSTIGYLQMAQNEHMTSKERVELLNIAVRQARRLETLLNDFFELSLIESADYHLSREQVHLNSLVIEVLIRFYDRFQEKGMEPTVHIPEQAIFIVANESAVIRVVENLLANAITHADGNIVINLEERDETVRLTVTNDAFSLTETDVQHMFDRFYMADKARSGKSTGLGLSIVKSLMKKMDGTITGRLNNGQLSIVCTWKRFYD